MEDILASIRRILSEDEQPAKPAAAAPPEPAPPAAAPAARAAPEEDDVLKLDESMLVAAPEAAPAEPVDEGMALVEAISAPGEPLEVALAMPEPVPEPPPPPVMPLAMPVAAPASDRLIAPEAEAATASSVSSLLRTLDSTRQAGGTLLYRGGPTLEDMVREEIRPLLKAWLDENLPPVVERLVRAEIERVVGRAVG
jgi:cell pole-organizing protein PopZ